MFQPLVECGGGSPKHTVLCPHSNSQASNKQERIVLIKNVFFFELTMFCLVVNICQWTARKRTNKNFMSFRDGAGLCLVLSAREALVGWTHVWWLCLVLSAGEASVGWTHAWFCSLVAYLTSLAILGMVLLYGIQYCW